MKNGFLLFILSRFPYCMVARCVVSWMRSIVEDSETPYDNAALEALIAAFEFIFPDCDLES